jgi:hypothetical protein
MQTGYTRWWCQRCKRPLSNDTALKPPTTDTISSHPSPALPGQHLEERFRAPRVRGPLRVTHDQCGGRVAARLPG